jgi:hypothetical protein
MRNGNHCILQGKGVLVTVLHSIVPLLSGGQIYAGTVVTLTSLLPLLSYPFVFTVRLRSSHMHAYHRIMLVNTACISHCCAFLAVYEMTTVSSKDCFS